MIKIMLCVFIATSMTHSVQVSAKSEDNKVAVKDEFIFREIKQFNDSVSKNNTSSSYIVERSSFPHKDVGSGSFIKQMSIEDKLSGVIPSSKTVIEICNRLGHSAPECHTAIIRYNHSIPYGTNFEIIGDKYIKTAGKTVELN